MNKKDKDNLQIARMLRNSSSYIENIMWYQVLRSFPVKFRRQQRIEGYVVDFFCSSAKVIVELDGEEHGEEQHLDDDIKRDEILSQKGYCVLRFYNEDVRKNLEGVATYLADVVKRRIKDPAIIEQINNLYFD